MLTYSFNNLRAITENGGGTRPTEPTHPQEHPRLLSSAKIARKRSRWGCLQLTRKLPQQPQQNSVRIVEVTSKIHSVVYSSKYEYYVPR
jgi:hypothetical protein